MLFSKVVRMDLVSAFVAVWDMFLQIFFHTIYTVWYKNIKDNAQVDTH